MALEIYDLLKNLLRMRNPNLVISPNHRKHKHKVGQKNMEQCPFA